MLALHKPIGDFPLQTESGNVNSIAKGKLKFESRMTMQNQCEASFKIFDNVPEKNSFRRVK